MLARMPFQHLFKVLLVLAMLGPIDAMAQTFPSKRITLVNPFPPGGQADLVGRIIAQYLTSSLGQPAVVENKTGAGGIIANEFVSKAPADGHTMLITTGAFTAQVAMVKQLPYDAINDFSMLTMVTVYPFVVSVPVSSPFKTMEEFISFVKANPRKLNYGSSGIGSGHHLAVELFNSLAGTEMVHVPFRGNTAFELSAGHVDVVFEVISDALPLIRSGKVRGLAVTSEQVSPILPDLPPVAKFLPGYDVTTFTAMAAPPKLDRAVAMKLSTEIGNALRQPETYKRLVDLGVTPQPGTPEQMRDYLQGQINKWKQVVTARKIEQIVLK